MESDRDRKPRVLIADDNPGIRQTLSEILDDEGYLVQLVDNGEAALAALTSSPVEVVLLDLAMPLMNGVEVLSNVEPPPPVVIIYSAFAYYDQEDVQRQTGQKVFRLLRKPVDPSTLVSVVAEAVASLAS